MHFREKRRRDMRYCSVLTQQRKQLILEALRRNGQVVAKDLSEELDLSEDTIRRIYASLRRKGCYNECMAGASGFAGDGEFCGATACGDG